MGIAGCLAIIIFFYKEPLMGTGFVKQHPTLMIHGFRGTERSMAYMIKRFESNGWGTHMQTCIVNNDGTLQWSRTKKAKFGSIPLIHVVFTNNTASLKQQGKWVAHIAEVIGNQYKTREINVIAHSMGGLAALKYITDSPPSAYPKVKKLVTLGTPAAGLDMKDLINQYPNAKKDEAAPASIDLQVGSSALKDLHQKFVHINQYDVNIFSVAGNSEKMGKTIGDGTVTENSALFLRGFSERVKIASFPVSHFDLHESLVIDHAVYGFVSEKK